MILSLLIILVTLVIFFWSIIVAASDAQGGIVYIVSMPVMLGLLWLGNKWSIRKKSRAGQIACKAMKVFYIGFIVFVFIPGLNEISFSIMNFTNKTFEKVTGVTPYKYFRQQNDIYGQVYDDAKTPDVIDMTTYKTSRDWDRVCFFGPETSDEEVQKIVGEAFKVSNFEGISDRIVTAVMFVDKDELSYPIAVSHKVADFSGLAGKCIMKEKARFRETPPGSKKYL